MLQGTLQNCRKYKRPWFQGDSNYTIVVDGEVRFQSKNTAINDVLISSTLNFSYRKDRKQYGFKIAWKMVYRQVKYRKFTNNLIFRYFGDVLKNPFRYVHLFLLHTLLSKKNSKNRHARPVTEGPKLRCNTPPLNEGLALINTVFCPTSSTYQKHLKLGQCLEIDDRRSLSKFGDVT